MAGNTLNVCLATEILEKADTTWRYIQMALIDGSLLPTDPKLAAWIAWFNSVKPYTSGNVDGDIPTEPERPV